MVGALMLAIRAVRRSVSVDKAVFPPFYSQGHSTLSMDILRTQCKFEINHVWTIQTYDRVQSDAYAWIRHCEIAPTKTCAYEVRKIEASFISEPTSAHTVPKFSMTEAALPPKNNTRTHTQKRL